MPGGYGVCAEGGNEYLENIKMGKKFVILRGAGFPLMWGTRLYDLAIFFKKTLEKTGKQYNSFSKTRKQKY